MEPINRWGLDWFAPRAKSGSAVITVPALCPWIKSLESTEHSPLC
jgi:hypothetical protein